MGGGKVKRHGESIEVWVWRNRLTDCVQISLLNPQHYASGDYSTSYRDSVVVCPEIVAKLTGQKFPRRGRCCRKARNEREEDSNLAGGV
jgi:hypothetical protein